MERTQMRNNREKVFSVNSWSFCQQHVPELMRAFKCRGKGMEQSPDFLKHRSLTLHWKTGFSSSSAHMWCIFNTAACYTVKGFEQCVCLQRVWWLHQEKTFSVPVTHTVWNQTHNFIFILTSYIYPSQSSQTQSWHLQLDHILKCLN